MSVLRNPSCMPCTSTGPDTIKGLRGTISKLELSIKELSESAKLKRFTQMQQQLLESDKAKAALVSMLTRSYGVDEPTLQQHIKEAVLKGAGGERLYGASRELLLLENKALRSQLEQRLVTDKTTWTRAGGGGGGGIQPVSPDRSQPKDQGFDATLAIQRAKSKAGSSRMERARMLAAPQVEALEQLSAALEDLREAERGHRLPNVANASVQASR